MSKEKYWKNPTYGMVYGLMVKTPEGQVVWPSLVTPKEFKGTNEDGKTSPPRYEITYLFDKNVAGLEEFRTGLVSMKNDIVALYNEGKKSGKIIVEDSEILQDGNDMDLVKYPYYKDKFYIVARNVKRVSIVGPEKDLVEPGFIQGGMHALAIVTPFICSHGLKYRLELVQFLRDTNERLGGARVAPESLLDVIGQEDTSNAESQDSSSIAASKKTKKQDNKERALANL